MAEHAPTIRFGVFELDLRTRELRKAGGKVRIQEQPLCVLVSLLERPGELVTRDELREKLWHADTFVDFDTGLNKAITKIRDVLGDSAASPRFVETLPKRGYRFIAPVETRAPEPGAPSLAPPGYYAALGDRERAFAWLEKAYRERTPGLIGLEVGFEWDSLRTDPRFQSLERRIGF